VRNKELINFALYSSKNPFRHPSLPSGKAKRKKLSPPENPYPKTSTNKRDPEPKGDTAPEPAGPVRIED
jgi:hypothetical protein